jgi:hypothetical protein
MKLFSIFAAIALLSAPAFAQDANGAGTRRASSQASAKPGLKKETPAVKKEDATNTAAVDESPEAPPAAPGSTNPQDLNGAGTRRASSQASAKPGLK